MQAKPDLHMARRHLDYLFNDLGDLRINVRAWGGQFPISRILTYSQAIDWVATLDLTRYEAFVGVCPRRVDAQNGKKAGVAEARMLWADLDGKDFAGGLDEARDRLAAFPLKPGLLIHSGNGWHAYWSLADAIPLSQPADIELVENYLAGIAATLGADSSCAEVGRVMRLAGSLNLKDRANPKLARIVETP